MMPPAAIPFIENDEALIDGRDTNIVIDYFFGEWPIEIYAHPGELEAFIRYVVYSDRKRFLDDDDNSDFNTHISGDKERRAYTSILERQELLDQMNANILLEESDADLHKYLSLFTREAERVLREGHRYEDPELLIAGQSFHPLSRVDYELGLMAALAMSKLEERGLYDAQYFHADGKVFELHNGDVLDLTGLASVHRKTRSVERNCYSYSCLMVRDGAAWRQELSKADWRILNRYLKRR